MFLVGKKTGPAPSSWVPWSSLVTPAPARQVLRALPGRPESSQKLVGGFQGYSNNLENEHFEPKVMEVWLEDEKLQNFNWVTFSCSSQKKNQGVGVDTVLLHTRIE